MEDAFAAANQNTYIYNLTPQMQREENILYEHFNTPPHQTGLLKLSLDKENVDEYLPHCHKAAYSMLAGYPLLTRD
jgi:hypothetical protein